MNLTHTDELLLDGLRAVPDKMSNGRCESLTSSDWDDFIMAAGRHGVAPLLYHHLSTSHLDMQIPDRVMGTLRKAYLENAARNMGLYHKLGKLLEHLRHEDIPVIVLKGAHLAALVYGNIALRPMSDVDILVHQEDVVRVGDKMLEMGYTPTQQYRQITRYNAHFAYGLPNKELFVEIHWTLLPSVYPFDIDTNGQWERSRSAIIAGVKVSVLCPEDMLLYLCLHASKHIFEMGLKHLCDIFETIRHYGEEIDWRQAQLRIDQWGIGKSAYLTLRLARELLGASVPDHLLKAIKPNDFGEGFMVMAKKSIFADKHYNADGLSLSPLIAQLWGSKRLLNKGILFLRRVFPSPEVMTQMYPVPSDSLLIYFYYPVRMIDLLLRHGRPVWRLLRGDKETQALAKQKNEIAPLKDWLMSL